MRVTLSGHETFPFRYGWLKKGFDAIQEDGSLFSADRAITELGVGKNMVKSIKYWCSAARLISADRQPQNGRINYLPTDIGTKLISDAGFDPYFEDPASLWIIQWQLASNSEQCATWFWLFNYWHGVEFTKGQIFNGVQKWLEQQNTNEVTESLLKRDIDCCLRTYVRSRHSLNFVSEESFDCPLTELNLISLLSDGKTYQFRRGEQNSLPDEILLFSITEFWNNNHSEANSIAFETLAYSVGSPGRIFKLDPDSLARRLDGISLVSGGIFSYQESAGIKQLFRHDDVPALAWLKHYYSKSR